jgi:NTP pyrophosphatase (non-canonical NTP hydrolase)
MDMQKYQAQAVQTDQVPLAVQGSASEGEHITSALAYHDASFIVPLLGLAGEAGGLLSEYKKYLRDGDAHRLFKDRVSEELGDILWYLTNVASKFGLDLANIAEDNLAKVRGRWGRGRERTPHAFDADFPEQERLPRYLVVDITAVEVEGLQKMRALVNGEPLGDDLTDNAYDRDGYRFHDVFHYAYAAVLGWSPVLRANRGCKRKSDPVVDEVEDGGRAAAIEEGLSAIIFDYAKDHNYLEGVTALDSQILRTITSVTSHLEVSACSVGDWERAVLQGYAVWREVVRHNGGRVAVDLDAQTITYASVT